MREPEINDTVRVITGSCGGDEEIIGRVKGYRSSDVGEYVVIDSHNVFRPSIKEWEVLKRSLRSAFKEKIEAFASLKKNWDSYGANPPSKATIEQALWLVSKLTDEELLTLEPIPIDEGIEFEGVDFTIRVWKE